MEGRDLNDPVAATKMDLGTDVNFGSLTRCMFDCLKKRDGVQLHFHHEVLDLEKEDDTYWHIKLKDKSSGEKKRVKAKFVFIGAGGGFASFVIKIGNTGG